MRRGVVIAFLVALLATCAVLAGCASSSPQASRSPSLEPWPTSRPSQAMMVAWAQKQHADRAWYLAVPASKASDTLDLYPPRATGLVWIVLMRGDFGTFAGVHYHWLASTLTDSGWAGHRTAQRPPTSGARLTPLPL